MHKQTLKNRSLIFSTKVIQRREKRQNGKKTMKHTDRQDSHTDRLTDTVKNRTQIRDEFYQYFSRKNSRRERRQRLKKTVRHADRQISPID